MKIFHLSDLHLGKRVNGYSMLEDQKYILGQILSSVQAEKPQAVIIAGDVYDRSMPSEEAVALLDDFLCKMVALAGCPRSLRHLREPRFGGTPRLRKPAN